MAYEKDNAKYQEGKHTLVIVMAIATFSLLIMLLIALTFVQSPSDLPLMASSLW